MTNQPHNSLSLNGLQLSVFLGVYPEELIKKQLVTVDICIAPLEVPKGCLSDELADTYCYDKLITHIKQAVSNRKFKLIEYLTHELYRLLLSYFEQKVRVLVRVTKKPAIADLSGGVTFELGNKD